MGPFPHDAPGGDDFSRQSNRHRWLRVCRIRASSTGTAARAVQADGLCAGRAPQDQEDHGLSPGRPSIISSTKRPAPTASISSPRTGRCAVDGLSRGRCTAGPSTRAVARRGASDHSCRPRKPSMFPRSRKSAAASCISSTTTGRRGRPTTPNSIGSAQRTRAPRAPGCSISITSPTTSIAAA